MVVTVPVKRAKLPILFYRFCNNHDNMICLWEMSVNSNDLFPMF